MEVIDYNKYENFIQVGHTATKSGSTYTSSDLEDFPTPSAIGYLLADVDKDAFTDLQGYTHRNRVRHDVLSLTLEYPVLSEDDLAYILNRISPQWFYVYVKNKKTKQYETHKMYASDKQFNSFRAWIDENDQWHEVHNEFTVTFVEE